MNRKANRRMVEKGMEIRLNIEHRTSNAQRRMKKSVLNLKDYFIFFSVVFMLVTNILINSSVSDKMSLRSSGFLISGTRCISFNHLLVSLSSFNDIRSLWIKSFGDSAAWASPWFGYGEVPDFSN